MTLPSVIRHSAAIASAAMPFSIESGTRVSGSFGARVGSGSAAMAFTVAYRPPHAEVRPGGLTRGSLEARTLQGLHRQGASFEARCARTSGSGVGRLAETEGGPFRPASPPQLLRAETAFSALA